MSDLTNSPQSAQEIERKYLVNQTDLPADWQTFPHKQIVQGYLAITDQGTEVRLRQKGERFFLTVKSGGDLSRSEGELELDASQFQTLWPFTAGQRVEKVRYEIPYQGLLIELDVYGGQLAGLITAEVEFDTSQASQQFQPPAWFGPEKTADSRYKNKNLALHGLPLEPA